MTTMSLAMNPVTPSENVTVIGMEVEFVGLVAVDEMAAVGLVVSNVMEKPWRVSIGWYAVAIGLPIALELVTVALNVAMGAHAPIWDGMRPWPTILGMTALYTVFSGPLGEELGWRGFALPRLLGRFAARPYGALVASLILGVIHAAWHLPLLLIGEQDVPSLLGPIVAAILITWLFQHVRGSVLLVALFHAAVQNSGRFLSPLFTGADATQQHWLRLAVWMAIAVVIVLVVGPARLARQPAVPAELIGTTLVPS